LQQPQQNRGYGHCLSRLAGCYLNHYIMSYYKHAQYTYSHKLRVSISKGHRSVYARYLAEKALERQRAIAKYKARRPPEKP